MLKKIKNLGIIIDFVATMIGVAIQKTNPNLSNVLMMYIGGLALVIAFLCVIVELFSKCKKSN